MINFVKTATHYGESYSCVRDNHSLGYLHRQEDGFYYFFPNHVPGLFWPSLWFKEIGNRLSDLNSAKTQNLIAEAYGDSDFTD